jgi:hypothetical protein
MVGCSQGSRRNPRWMERLGATLLKLANMDAIEPVLKK